MILDPVLSALIGQSMKILFPVDSSADEFHSILDRRVEEQSALIPLLGLFSPFR